MDNLGIIWTEVLSLSKNEIQKASFDTWLKSTKLISYEGSRATVSTTTPFIREHLEKFYTELISRLLTSLIGEEVAVKFVVKEDKNSKNIDFPAPKVGASSDEQESFTSVLNSKYTFDTFVVGSGNRFAHAASLAVAEAPATMYNPFYIYGGVGLGKTHLMHAIGHYVLTHNPNAKIVYLTSEKFTNEFITSIQKNEPNKFRDKYRNVDILLIDDIQFLAGKEGTQEEFFHTFNTLHGDKKQIIISSDCPPKEIPTLEERLRSRFEWGLITDIAPPDLETRIAILRKKAEADHLTIADEVILYIANQIDSNIRELEGSLTRVVAHADLINEELTPEVAAKVLKDIVPNSKPRIITILDIQKVVAEHYKIRLEDFPAKKRTKSIAFPRQVAMYLSRELTDSSLHKIGEEFGGRDHSTVLHAHEKITKLLEEKSYLQEDLKQITSMLGK